MPKTVSGDTTVNSQRKGVPDSWSSYSKTMRTKACADKGNKHGREQCPRYGCKIQFSSTIHKIWTQQLGGRWMDGRQSWWHFECSHPLLPSIDVRPAMGDLV